MMRALTLTQPWAGLVASGIKLIENRTRRPPASVIGQRFAIHASREYSLRDVARIIAIAPELEHDDPRWHLLARVQSAVIGVATLERIVIGKRDDLLIDESGNVAAGIGDQHRWFFGPFGYVLRDVFALPQPVPCKGALGFWRLGDADELAVRAQLVPTCIRCGEFISHAAGCIEAAP